MAFWEWSRNERIVHRPTGFGGIFSGIVTGEWVCRVRMTRDVGGVVEDDAWEFVSEAEESHASGSTSRLHLQQKSSSVSESTPASESVSGSGHWQ